MEKRWAIHAVLLFVSLIYGANYNIAKAVMPHYLTPFAFIIIRVTVATALFWAYAALTVKERITRRKDYYRIALCALLGVATNQLALFSGLNYTTPVTAAVIMTIVPIVVMVASYFMLHEKITLRKTIGLALGATGTVLLILHGSGGLETGSLLGNLLIVLNATSYGMYLVVVKPLMQRYDAITVIKWMFLMGCFIVLPFGFGPVQQIQFSSFSLAAWGALAFVIIGTTFLAYLLNAKALRRVSSSIVGYYIYVQPVFSAFISVMAGQEEFSVQKILYSLIIFSGVYLVSTRPKSAKIAASVNAKN